jgi:hypothetical protein
MRIKVTGYLDPALMDPKHVDLNHEMGVSEDGYLYLASELALDDVTLELVKDGDDE